MKRKPTGVGRPKGSGKGRTEALLVRFSPEELERAQRAAARAGQATSQRIRLALAREAVLEAVQSLYGPEEARRDLVWMAMQNLSAGTRERWLPPALQRFERESTKAALDRVRGAVKRLDEIEDEFFSAGLSGRGRARSERRRDTMTKEEARA